MRQPILHTKPEAKSVTGASIHALVDLLVDVEKRLTNGPWDDWDAVVLAQWKEIVRRRLREALTEVDRLLGLDTSGGYKIVEEATQ